MPEIGEIRKATEIGYSGGNKWVWSACLDCGEERWVQLAWDKPVSVRCRICSARTPDKIQSSRRFMTGETHPQWKGGKTKARGYIYVRLYPDDFF